MPSDKTILLARHTSSLNADPTDPTKVKYWISRPLEVGFLKAFSFGEHNSENISFIMEIATLKDHMDVDKYAWSQCKGWQVVDSTLDIDAQIEEEETKAGDADVLSATLQCAEVVCSKAGWPATKLPKSQLVKHVQEIWDTYFAPSATFEICISMTMRRRVVFRLKHLHLYGKEAFDEALIDPMKTVAKDIIPRFTNSTFYRNMVARVEALSPLPTADQLPLKPPADSAVLKMDMRKITLEDLKAVSVYSDFVLYDAFKAYLTSVVAVELLLCIHAIYTFQALWVGHDATAKDPPPGADDASWTVYMYFVAQGSAYEVSLSERRRKGLMHHMGTPSMEMYDKVLEQQLMTIAPLQERFYGSKYFTGLPDEIKIMQRLPQYKDVAPPGGCFAFL